MNGRYLLDTNIVIALFDKDSEVIQNIKSAGKIFIPAPVIGELYYGAFKSTKQSQNLKRINELRAELNILDCDKSTAKYCGEIKNNLRRKGKPIPENDIWIGALSYQHNLTLVSRDKHFNNIDKITTEKW